MVMKPKNLRWFSSPTHPPIQKQWWSNLRTHLLQSLQCLALKGNSFILHISHALFLGTFIKLFTPKLGYDYIFYLISLSSTLGEYISTSSLLLFDGCLALVLFSIFVCPSYIEFPWLLSVANYMVCSSSDESSSELTFWWLLIAAWPSILIFEDSMIDAFSSSSGT